MSRRVVLYLRLSRASDTSTAIDGQNAALREYVARMGWTVVRVLADDGLSGRKRRANADECLRMLEAHEADLLAVYAVDRWTREGLEVVGELCGVLRRSGGAFYALRENLSNETSANFELELGIHASIAKTEGELIAGRVRASRKRLDEAGRFKGGIVPFGYRLRRDSAGVYLEHDPDEVPWVDFIAASVLAGVSLTAITTRLREALVPTTKSPARKARQRGESTHDLSRGVWHLQIVRKLATSPTIAGYTTTGGAGLPDHERPIVRDRAGAPKVVAPPIVDAETFARLRAALPPGRPKRTRAARLLSGVAYCECGAKCYVITSGRDVYYRCSARSFDQAAPCTGPRILAADLEHYVAERYLAVVGDSPEFETVDTVENGASAAELADVEATLADASAAMLEDGADLAAIVERIGTLKARRTALRDIPATVTSHRLPTGRTCREAWDTALDDDRRRSLLLEVIDHVEVCHVTVPNTPEHRARILWTEAAEDDSRYYADADEDLRAVAG